MKQSESSSLSKTAPTLGAVNLKDVLTTDMNKIVNGLEQSRKIIEDYMNDCSTGNLEPDDDRFTVDKLVFASGEKDKNGTIIIGSLYFQDGCRIRLCHTGGPGISEHKTTTQYCLKNEAATTRFNYLADPIYNMPEIYRKVKRLLKKKIAKSTVVTILDEDRSIRDWIIEFKTLKERYLKPREIESILLKEGHIESAGENVSGTLLEIDDDNVHISAGGPVPVPSDMNQNKLNALLRAAKTNNNVAMQLCFKQVAEN